MCIRDRSSTLKELLMTENSIKTNCGKTFNFFFLLTCVGQQIKVYSKSVVRTFEFQPLLNYLIFSKSSFHIFVLVILICQQHQSIYSLSVPS